MDKIRPVILAILDGWGIAPPNKGNAVALAKTPCFDMVVKKYPYTELRACGKAVGLTAGQDGNSEAGHMNIGAGRVVDQDAIIIQGAIKDGTFYKNPAFLTAIDNIKKNRSKIHIMGLLSDNNSPHAYPPHLYALLELLRKYKIHNVILHLFTDGRDSFQHAALGILKELQSKFINNEKIATIMGRYYGMERNKRWPITEQAYDALTIGIGEMVAEPVNAIERAYNRGKTDEFIKPAIIGKNKKDINSTRISEKDSVIFYNLRSDRTRQITKCFTQKNFNKMNPGSFKRKKVLKDIKFIAMTDFSPDLDNIITAFPSADIKQTLPMILKEKQQLYIAESEKYAHVTYFFNGGYADPVANEIRLNIPSPDIIHYDKKPEMSARKITDEVVKNMKKNNFDFYCINYANPDMVGHTGNLESAIIACSFVDKQLARLSSEIKKQDGVLVITADHGNAEEMINLKTNEIDTKHSTNPVPFVVFSEKMKHKKLKGKSVCLLGDIASTLLEIIEVEKPSLMKGKTIWK